jgi:hypothetical protein
MNKIQLFLKNVNFLSEVVYIAILHIANTIHVCTQGWSILLRHSRNDTVELHFIVSEHMRHLQARTTQ